MKTLYILAILPVCPTAVSPRTPLSVFSEQIIRFLKTKQVKAIVIACNTASALALDAVRDEFDIPIMGVVIPGARAAVEATRNRKVGVVGNRRYCTERCIYQGYP